MAAMKEIINPQEGMADRLRKKAKGLPPVIPQSVTDACKKAARPEYIRDILAMQGTVEEPHFRLLFHR